MHRCGAPDATTNSPQVADLIAGYERRLSDEGDAIERFIGVPLVEASRDLYRAASPAHALLPLATPTLVVTGTRDVDVPPDMTRAFFDRASAAAVASSGPTPHFLEISEADHYDLLDAASPSWASLLSAIGTQLGSGASVFGDSYKPGLPNSAQ